MANGSWMDKIFDAQQANEKGGVVRRSRADVDAYGGIQALIDAVKAKNFHLIETGDQCVILCHAGSLVIHC